MTVPISNPSITVIHVQIKEKQGCWPFRRVVRKKSSTEFNDLVNSTLRVSQAQDNLKRSPGHEDIASLAKKLEEGRFFEEDLAEAKKIQRGDFS